MSATVLAGAFGQWPLGRLSDRHDRRKVLMGAALLGAAAAIGLAVFQNAGEGATYALVAVFGAMAFPIYAISVAHMNDYVAQDEFVEASSVMLLLFASGAAVGAIPASLLMGEIGPRGLFAFTALAHLSLAVFAFYRMRKRPSLPSIEKSRFVGVPRTSPTLFALDPRSPDVAFEDVEVPEIPAVDPDAPPSGSGDADAADMGIDGERDQQQPPQ